MATYYNFPIKKTIEEKINDLNLSKEFPTPRIIDMPYELTDPKKVE